jgi:hypothetical protein
MSDTAQIVSNIVTNLGIVTVAYLAYRTKIQSKETHDSVNSRLDKYIAASVGKAHAEGVIQEKTDEQARQSKAKG